MGEEQMNEKIMVVDDEAAIADLVEVYLENEGYAVYKCGTGGEALACVARERPDLAILDVMLPDVDGFTLCQKIREEHLFPILMLTAKVEDMDKITGLTLGADDYITKPFSLALLYAKTTALIRRSRGTEDGALVCGAIRLQPGPMLCTVCNTAVKLSPREYDLLLCLLRNRGKVLSREQLLARVWGWDFEGEDRAVDVQVKNLRAALGSAGKQIKTVFKAGYKLESE